MTFKELQEQANLNNIDTASYLGVSLRTVYRWIAGDTKPPKSALMLLQLYITKKELEI